MYVHIGDNKSIPIENIVTMIHANGSKSKKSPLHYYDDQLIYIVPMEEAKTFLITNEGVYVSGISIKTLMKRIDEFNTLITQNL